MLPQPPNHSQQTGAWQLLPRVLPASRVADAVGAALPGCFAPPIRRHVASSATAPLLAARGLCGHGGRVGAPPCPYSPLYWNVMGADPTAMSRNRSTRMSLLWIGLAGRLERCPPPRPSKWLSA